jgi:predicted DNA-binding protein with PD1-like motif
MEYKRFNNSIVARIDKGELFGGHLNRAIVSATCKMVINIIDGKVDRYFDEKIGLNFKKILYKR